MLLNLRTSLGAPVWQSEGDPDVNGLKRFHPAPSRDTSTEQHTETAEIRTSRCPVQVRRRPGTSKDPGVVEESSIYLPRDPQVALLCT